MDFLGKWIGEDYLRFILSWFYEQDAGEIYIEGEKVSLNSIQKALKNGIGMVHQERQFIPSYTSLQNIVLGHQEHPGRLNYKRAEREVLEIFDRYGFEIDIHEGLEEVKKAFSTKVKSISFRIRSWQIILSKRS